MKKCKLSILFGSLFAVMLMAVSADAALLQVDFQQGADGDASFAVDQYAGTGAAPFGTNSWIYASSDSAPGVTATGISGSFANTNMTVNLADGVELMNDYVYVRNGVLNLNVATGGVPGTDFTMYIYSNGDQERQGGIITPAVASDATYDQASLSTDPTGAIASTALTEGLHYVVFTGTLGASAELSFDVTINPISGNQWSAVNGFQLEFVPEPASLALLSFGVIGCLCSTRKRG